MNQRVANAQMEPRSAIVSFDPVTGIYSMIAGSQGAVRQRDALAAALGVEKDQVEVVCPDVGGGFGPRANLAPEQPMLAVAARMVGRPVRWTSTRSEAFLTDYQGRDLGIRARMGFTSDSPALRASCAPAGERIRIAPCGWAASCWSRMRADRREGAPDPCPPRGLRSRGCRVFRRPAARGGKQYKFRPLRGRPAGPVG